MSPGQHFSPEKLPAFESTLFVLPITYKYRPQCP
jgi:hypothetical protein